MIGNRLMMMTDDEIRDAAAAADVFKKSQSRGSDIDLIDYSIHTLVYNLCPLHL